MRSSAMQPRLLWRKMPDTSAYYHLAYTVALGIYTIYGLSLYLRRKRVRAK
jgi:hypothetical protein